MGRVFALGVPISRAGKSGLSLLNLAKDGSTMSSTPGLVVMSNIVSAIGYPGLRRMGRELTGWENEVDVGAVPSTWRSGLSADLGCSAASIQSKGQRQRQGRPFPAIHRTIPPLRCGPSFRTFAAGAISSGRRTGKMRDLVAVRKCSIERPEGVFSRHSTKQPRKVGRLRGQGEIVAQNLGRSGGIVSGCGTLVTIRHLNHFQRNRLFHLIVFSPETQMEFRLSSAGTHV